MNINLTTNRTQYVSWKCLEVKTSGIIADNELISQRSWHINTTCIIRVTSTSFENISGSLTINNETVHDFESIDIPTYGQEMDVVFIPSSNNEVIGQFVLHWFCDPIPVDATTSNTNLPQPEVPTISSTNLPLTELPTEIPILEGPFLYSCYQIQHIHLVFHIT